MDFKQRVSSFEALGLRHDVLKALDAMNITQPTVIQVKLVVIVKTRKAMVHREPKLSFNEGYGNLEIQCWVPCL